MNILEATHFQNLKRGHFNTNITPLNNLLRTSPQVIGLIILQVSQFLLKLLTLVQLVLVGGIGALRDQLLQL